MELFQKILCSVLAREEIQVTFPNLSVGEVRQIVEGKCYQALHKIHAILNDSSLEDSECFMRIEEIVRAFEAIGAGGGRRHDFG